MTIVPQALPEEEVSPETAKLPYKGIAHCASCQRTVGIPYPCELCGCVASEHHSRLIERDLLDPNGQEDLIRVCIFTDETTGCRPGYPKLVSEPDRSLLF